MESIREYLIGVTAAALICAVMTKLLGKGTLGAVVKLIAGIFMALAIISPMVDIRIEELTDFVSDIKLSADDAAVEGENSARAAVESIITERTREYILDKAEALGLEMTVEVELDTGEIPVPRAVTLSGDISPYAKAVLSEYIAANLGIEAEEQTWKS